VPKQYTVEVMETRQVRVLYTVQAEDELEAKELAETGETVDEHEIDSGNVTNRTILREPEFQTDLQ
jgi:hypothetical protein